jgi:hypothetical protein
MNLGHSMNNTGAKMGVALARDPDRPPIPATVVAIGVESITLDLDSTRVFRETRGPAVERITLSRSTSGSGLAPAAESMHQARDRSVWCGVLLRITGQGVGPRYP